MRNGAPCLRVIWNTPQSDLTISQYQVQYGRHGSNLLGSQITVPGLPPATSTIMCRLHAGTEYSIIVRARSDIGDGEWSEKQTEKTFDREILYSMLLLVACALMAHTYYGKK